VCEMSIPACHASTNLQNQSTVTNKTDATAYEIRLERLRSPISRRSVMVALDATLYSGPTGRLAHPQQLTAKLLGDGPDAVLAFPGLLASSLPPDLRVGRIMSASASSTLDDPLRKVVTGTPASALRLGADAASLHINFGHPATTSMLEEGAKTIEDFRDALFPVVVAAYIANADPIEGWPDVAHAARTAVDLGASVVKTAYTGSADSYRHVVDAAAPALVVAAGGPMVSTNAALSAAEGAIRAGAQGVCYGRAIFESDDPPAMLRALKAIIHDEVPPADAAGDAGLATST
jgi:fructose-bisphosphate aldolase/2-amino-3,7-dideoxy-D-threo-hept-6-ulosonate synthase